MRKNLLINIVCVVIIAASGVGMAVMLPGAVEKTQSRNVGDAELPDDQEALDGFLRPSLSDCSGKMGITTLTYEEAVKIVEATLLDDFYKYAVCDFVPKGMLKGRGNIIATRIISAGASDSDMLEVLRSEISVEEPERVQLVHVVRLDDIYAVAEVTINMGVEEDWYQNYKVVFFSEEYLAVDLDKGSYKFLKKDKESMVDILGIIIYGETWSHRASGVGLYSYEMKDTGSTYEFIYDFATLNLDRSISEEIFDKLNLVQWSCEVNKSNGILEGCGEKEILKTFDLTNEEVERIRSVAKSSDAWW